MRSSSSGVSPRPAASEADPLVSIIALLRPRTVLSKLVSGAGKWSVRYERSVDPAFGLVLAGSCHLDVDGVGVVALQEGDFILLPATPGFTMASDLAVKPKLVAPSHGAEIRHGTKVGAPTLRLLGGWFRFDRANADLVLKLLPAIVLIRRDEAEATRVRRLAELIADEADARRPGRELVLERLVEVLLVEALRFRTAGAEKPEQGLLAGLADPALARSLRGIHADVARRWSVAELAKTAGMSRAVFAERFARRVGMPPMEYLLEWRMALARDMLRRERPPLAEVAERVGYQSASAFSTAFTRLIGRSPSDFARSAG